MTALLIHHLADYDLWANDHFIDRLRKEPDAVLDAAVASSFPSLRQTILHMRNAVHTWHGRLMGTPTAWPANDLSDIGDLVVHVRTLHAAVLKMDDADLFHECTYRDLRGNAYAQPAWQLLLHCFNHNTQHRGQLITMMRALGRDDIPATDLVRYQRTLRA
ncbi:MAG: DinB family protein [Flavobacteriales bacterium]